MGYMRHHAIVVTSWSDELMEKAHAKARKIFPTVSDLMNGSINGYLTFAIPPDGSKEGWGESADGDSRRDSFVAWLKEQAYDDGSSALAWVEVQYGDDNKETLVVHHSDEKPTTSPADGGGK